LFPMQIIGEHDMDIAGHVRIHPSAVRTFIRCFANIYSGMSMDEVPRKRT
jgi:hypothetical protein